jgi:hypothetical protein
MRVNAVSGMYSPGPTFGEVVEAGFFMPPSLPHVARFGTLASVVML